MSERTMYAKAGDPHEHVAWYGCCCASLSDDETWLCARKEDQQMISYSRTVLVGLTGLTACGLMVLACGSTNEVVLVDGDARPQLEIPDATSSESTEELPSTPDAARPPGKKDAAAADAAPVAPPDPPLPPLPPRTYRAVRMGVGSGFKCSLVSSGDVYCWGRNFTGQLGDGTTVDQGRPRKVVLAGPATDVSVGTEHACAMLSSGVVQCWGRGGEGQLGHGSLGSSGSRRLPVNAGSDIFDRLRVAGMTSCAKLAGSGTWKCWGAVGIGNIAAPQDFGIPNDIVPPCFVDPAPVGVLHSPVQCWRINPPAGIDRLNLVDVRPSIAETLKLGKGCAVDSRTNLWCWGRNTSGQITQPPSTNEPPTIVGRNPTGPGGWASATQYGSAICAVRPEGSVHCFGDRQFLPAETAAGVTALEPNIVQIDESCALSASGRIQCWAYTRNPIISYEPGF
jgi:hypothetical protein